MDRKKHWEHVYQTRRVDEVSWFQPEATLSLELIQRVTSSSPDSHIVDVGAGASTLVDGLIAAGYSNVTLLDLSHAALGETKSRLGDAASKWFGVKPTYLPHDSMPPRLTCGMTAPSSTF